ncbi:hypothetical protein GIB67_015395 [Kingdonia uniflora]|uniref:Uncharacterized protein n=1 Tax=Kingdonia uniflora TaxID=39325 RepID=A0A7J7KZ14_9MAGN|nr:hypothetical protein GIB67_015395 [Kingdonia uniflora]
MCGVSVESKPENLEGTNDTLSDSESVQARYPALKKLQISISDLTIFKFCLGGIYDRSLLLKDVAMSASDQEINNLAHQVSLYTGCSHHKYQISMTKRLIQEGTSTWTLISHSNQQVLWENAVVEIEEQFMKISRCNTKSLTGQVPSFFIIQLTTFTSL